MLNFPRNLSSQQELIFLGFLKVFLPFQKNYQNCDFLLEKMKNTESPKITSKVLNELLTRSYDQFECFSQTLFMTTY